MMKKTIDAYVLACLCLILAGCKGSEGRKTAPVEVKVCRITASVPESGNRYSGTVEEAKGAMLSFAVGGTVESILVHEGQRIAKGQLIAVLDKTSLEQAHEAAAAMLEQATDACNRMRQLHDNGSLPEIQWVEVQSKLRQAQSAESIARKNLADSRLYAPFSGVVSEKAVESGQNVSPGMPVVRIVCIDRVKVSISVPENEMSGIRTGGHAEISIPALGGKPYTGTIAEKGVAADNLSRAYEVKICVDNPLGELLPGMICEADVCHDTGRTAIILPANVVGLTSDNRHFVWVCDKDKAVRRFVETGEMTDGGVTITNGLHIGDEVIVEGQQKVSEGMNICRT
ncbi:MAG: efflux RND transporter periplasmic adaptor subunit [Prevotella sp.]